MNENKQPANGDEISGDPWEATILQDDQGYYKIFEREREIPRKTYLSGALRGKYRGEIAGNKNGYEYATFYDFHIYEADVCFETVQTCSCITLRKRECHGLHTEAEGGFDLPGEFDRFSEKLPQPLPVRAERLGREYIIHVYEPQLAHIRFRLHQTEGKEVFGTIEANITGFLLDLEVVASSERVYFRDNAIEREPPVEAITRELIKSIFPQAP